MNFNEKKDQIKTWARDNKGKIIIGSVTLATIAITAIIHNKPKTDNEVAVTIVDSREDYFDYGKDLEMHFVDPDNGEVLWKELCTESYMNEMRDWGMQFENVRKLNGIEKA